jgi:sulfoxide reductase catalytic subunit YedY
MALEIDMSDMTRRQFTRLVLGGITLSVLSGCAPEEAVQATPTLRQPFDGAQDKAQDATLTPTPTAKPTLAPTPTATSVASPGVTPTPSPTSVLLHNENRPGFYIRYYKPFEPVDPNRWTLSVEGLVKSPQELTLSDIQSLPLVSQVSRIKCVECWSAAAKWEGFHLRSLMEIVDPLPEAKWLHFYCADDYYESLNLEELLMERVLFVHRMNDQILPDVYGAPLRLMVPFKYGYKSPKAIVQLVFAKEESPGYWPTVGPYTTTGEIQPGGDYPLDLGEPRQIAGGGEIRYPDGIESRGE